MPVTDQVDDGGRECRGDPEDERKLERSAADVARVERRATDVECLVAGRQGGINDGCRRGLGLRGGGKIRVPQAAA